MNVIVEDNGLIPVNIIVMKRYAAIILEWSGDPVILVNSLKKFFI